MQQGNKVHVEFSCFSGPYSYFNGTHDLVVTPAALMWATITVGAPSFAAVVASLADSVTFALHKALAILTVTDWSAESLRIPAYYGRLEQSEKTALAYWTGMALSKLVADVYLNIPWLQHIRSLRQQGLVTVSPPLTESLPDLAGLDCGGRWHVIEAKARRRSPSKRDSETWKKQANVVTQIDGKPPSTSTYCAALWGDPYSVQVVDPTPNEDGANGMQLAIKTTSFMKAYYQPVIEFVGMDTLGGANPDEPVFRTAGYDPVTDRYYELGLLPRIYHAIRSGTHVVPVNHYLDDYGYMGSDGIAIRSRPVTT